MAFDVDNRFAAGKLAPALHRNIAPILECTVRLVHRNVYRKRITLIVVVVVLSALDNMPIFSEPWVVVRCVVAPSFPALLGAVAMDSFDKE